jgi:hypothetical protein
VDSADATPDGSESATRDAFVTTDDLSACGDQGLLVLVEKGRPVLRFLGCGNGSFAKVPLISSHQPYMADWLYLGSMSFHRLGRPHLAGRPEVREGKHETMELWRRERLQRHPHKT